MTSSKKTDLTKLKIAVITIGSILGAGLIYEILGNTILDVPAILKCIKTKIIITSKRLKKQKLLRMEKIVIVKNLKSQTVKIIFF